jgi:uncharacterized membrane protein (DUF373 family)
MTANQDSPERATANRFQVVSGKSMAMVEMVIYAALGVILSFAAVYALFTAFQTLWQGLAAGESAKTIVEVIDRLLAVLMLVEILHTVRISIRSHTLVTEPFLVVGLIATIRRMLVITLDAANLTSAANWANDGQARLRASLLELGLLGAIVIVLVISIHILRKSRPPEEEEETRQSEAAGSAQSG